MEIEKVKKEKETQEVMQKQKEEQQKETEKIKEEANKPKQMKIQISKIPEANADGSATDRFLSGLAAV